MIIVVALFINPALHAGYIEHCASNDYEECDVISYGYWDMHEECWTEYRDMEDGEEGSQEEYEVCEWIEEWIDDFQIECHYYYIEDCSDEWEDEPAWVNINPDSTVSLTLGQSQTYSSTAWKGLYLLDTDKNCLLSAHSIDWKAPDANWVSTFTSMGTPGSTSLGALTGDMPRGVAGLFEENVLSITLTPSEPGSYSVRFYGVAENGRAIYSRTRTLNVANAKPAASINIPEIIHVDQDLPIQLTISNTTGLDHYLLSYQIEEKRTTDDGTVYQDWTIIASQAGLAGTQIHTWSGTASPVTQKGTVNYRVRTGNQWVPETSDSGEIYSVQVLQTVGAKALGIASNWATITWLPYGNNQTYRILLNGAAVVSTKATTYTLTGLSPATTYTITVQILDSAGNVSDPGIPLMITTRLDNPVISDITPAGITLAWNGSTHPGITYEIERSTDGINFTKIQDITGALTYTDTQVESGVTYYYRIRTSGSGGTSGYTSTVTTTRPPPPQPPDPVDTPPQTGLRLWLKAAAGIETDSAGRVLLWRDQSTSQAHAILAQGGIGPQINTSSDLGFTTIAFNGQTNALELPPFMDNATAAIAYAIVKSEKTNNPLWSMGDTPAGTLYPGESGRIEDDFASTTVQAIRASNPPLYEWHAYQVTSSNGVWWPAIDQTLLPIKKNMAVETFTWSDTIAFPTRSEMSIAYFAESGTDSPLPALLPEKGYLFDATVQAADPSLANNYFGLNYIGLRLEDGSWLDYLPGINEAYVKKTPFTSGTARLTLALDEVETFLGTSLRDKQISRINLELESVALNADGSYAGISYFLDNHDIKTNFAIAGTETKSQFGFAALPEIGNGFKGEIAEILIYDQTAPADESVNSYLSSKYGVFVASSRRDSDGDGIPDAWEIRNGLNPLDPSDALGDADGHGTTHLQKYLDSLQPGIPRDMSSLIIRMVDRQYWQIETQTWAIAPASNQ